MNYKKISIVIPTYNERENIKKIIPEIVKICEKNFEDFEIIVVDDNSPDKTYEEVKKFKDERIKVFVRKKEKGLASAIKFGIEKSKYKYVCIMDADFQHPPKFIPKLYEKLIENSADISIASRFLDKSVKRAKKIRIFFSKIAIFLISSFFPNLNKVSDPLSGFFLLNKEKVNLKEMKCIGFKFLFELLAKQKLKIVEVPFKFEKRKEGKSKMGFKEVYNFLKLFLTLLRETKEYKRIIKFSLVGASGIFVNEFLLYFFTELLNFYYIFSSVISIEISIIWNFLFCEFFVFRDLRKRGIRNFVSRMLKTNIVRIFGLIINVIVLFVLTEFFSINYLISNLIGIFAAVIFNYMLSLKKVYLNK
ncbi:MAG: glycosyltransferase [Candidatus Aenigmatarchaeota archaeon]